MNSQELIELTRQLIYHATHFDLPFVKETYADKFIYISVDEQDAVNLMDKQQLMAFIQQNREAKTEPFSTKTEFHYAVVDGNIGMAVMTRELELNGHWSRKFFTVTWEYLDGRWQIARESSVDRGGPNLS